MRNDLVPDEHHVSRLCGGSHIREDGSISATAFKLRPGETYLSVNWLECLGLSDREAALIEVRRVLALKRGLGTTARLGVLNVGRVRTDVLGQSGIAISVRHEPELDPARPLDASHSGIHGIQPDDNIVPELLARAVMESHAAR